MTTHRRRPTGATHSRRPSRAARPGRPTSTPQPRRPSGETDPTHLISGYATETLSRAEQRRLYRAALDDQEVFDRLVEEESWRQIFEAPGVREEVLQALAETPAATTVPEVRRPGVAAGRRPGVAPGPGGAPEVRRHAGSAGIRGLLAGLRGSKRGSGRYIPPMVMGTAAAALLAVALIPRWTELGMTGPVEEAAPRTASSSTELVSKSYDARSSAGAETPVNDLVPKSYGGSDPGGTEASPRPMSSTRGLQSKSPSGVLNISYVLELNQLGGPREVADAWRFRAGDQFRLRLDLDFDAWVYLFNRATGDTVYTLLYPGDSSEHVPLSSSQGVVLPPDTWLTMDATPEDEQLVLVISAKSGRFAARRTIPVSELDAALAVAEARLASLNWRRSEVGERVRLAVENSDSLAVVVRLLGG